MNKQRLVFAFVLTTALSTGPFSAQAEDKPQVDFARQILPILSNKCFVCHGPDTKDADQLRLDSAKSATRDRGG